jgi:hypothetical protein
MNDAVWKLVEEAFEAARRHFELAVALYDKDTMTGTSNDAYYASMAFMHGMFAAHSSVETGLERILDLYEETVPVGKTSHLDILKVAAMATPLRPPILDAATFTLLNETRRFRHVAAHSYADFEPAKADPSVAAARTLAATLPTVFSRFRTAVGDFNGAA